MNTLVSTCSGVSVAFCNSQGQVTIASGASLTTASSDDNTVAPTSSLTSPVTCANTAKQLITLPIHLFPSC